LQSEYSGWLIKLESQIVVFVANEEEEEERRKNGHS
jgi:hypothetical protein